MAAQAIQLKLLSTLIYPPAISIKYSFPAGKSVLKQKPPSSGGWIRGAFLCRYHRKGMLSTHYCSVYHYFIKKQGLGHANASEPRISSPTYPAKLRQIARISHFATFRRRHILLISHSASRKRSSKSRDVIRSGRVIGILFVGQNDVVALARLQPPRPLAAVDVIAEQHVEDLA